MRNKLELVLFIGVNLRLLWFCLSLCSHHSFDSKSFIFNCTVQKKVNITCNSWIASYPHPYCNVYLVLLILIYLVCHFVVCSSKFWHFRILEGLENKRLAKWWLSQYVYNEHNAMWKALWMVFTHSLFLYQKSLWSSHWYVNNSCINTVHIHFQWSILYIQNYISALSIHKRSNIATRTCTSALPDW